MRSPLTKFACILISLLIIGASNHCALEDLFVLTCFESTNSTDHNHTETQPHTENHPGAAHQHTHSTDDQHNNLPEPHKHGQIHNILAVFKSENDSFSTLRILCLPLISLFSLLALLGLKESPFKHLNLTVSQYRYMPLSSMIGSLLLASQAPPFSYQQ